MATGIEIMGMAIYLANAASRRPPIEPLPDDTGGALSCAGTIGGMNFSIRDLIWLTMLAAVAVAWWLDRSELRRVNVQLEEQRRNAAADFQAWELYIGRVKE